MCMESSDSPSSAFFVHITYALVHIFNSLFMASFLSLLSLFLSASPSLASSLLALLVKGREAL